MGYLRGVVHGMIIGGAVALLYAPKPGRQMREDLSDRDGTHPSSSGREKVAQMLLKFLKSDPTARPWFTRVPGKSADAAVPRAQLRKD